VKERKTGESIEEVEELMRHHADFEKTVNAQQEKVNALLRNEKVSCRILLLFFFVVLCFTSVAVLLAL
jgi:hypothetical protein